MYDNFVIAYESTVSYNIGIKHLISFKDDVKAMLLNRPNKTEKPAEMPRKLIPKPNRINVIPPPKPGEVVTYSRVKHTPMTGTLRNLRPVEPGEIRNPKGKPKKEFCIADILDAQSKMPLPYEMRIKLQKIMPEELLKNCTIRQAMLYRTYFDAAAFGDSRAREFIADRLEGKVSQPFSIGEMESSNTDDLMKLLSQNVKALQDANNA
jgi:hypothetical protein